VQQTVTVVGTVRALGFQKTAVGLFALFAVFFHHILSVAGIASYSFIATAKTSVT